MRIIAIDPGYDRLGVAVLERVSGVDQLLFSTCILTNKADDLPARIVSAGDALVAILDTHKPSVLAIETLFFNKNIKTGIGVAQMRGVCLYLAITHGCTVAEYSPQQIKVAVTGYGNSDKAAVTMMVKRLVRGVPDTAVDDEYDAIATGITCLAHQRF
jgi:crossover junction endodeoxyribonuclease RuvC